MRLCDLWRHPLGVPRTEKPRAEGRFHLVHGRRLGYAEFGDPSGDVVVWCHGTPGGRRQFPLLGRRAAEKLGLRVILVERPGSGLSDPHPYNSVAEWATDVAHVADTVGAERLAVVGLSGGGPYALACAAVPPLAGRVAAVGVLGGVVPAVGPEASATGAIELARRFAPVLSTLRRPLAMAVSAVLLPMGGAAGGMRPISKPKSRPWITPRWRCPSARRSCWPPTTSAVPASGSSPSCRSMSGRCRRRARTWTCRRRALPAPGPIR